MSRWPFPLLAIATLGLGACGQADSSLFDQPANLHGRYAGVGLYGPGRQWTKLVAAQSPSADPQTAKRIDDQIIIVVQDTATGEVRACGDLTGYCIGMNPWKTALLGAQIAPLKLTDHRAPDDTDASIERTAKPHHPRKPKRDRGAGEPGSAAAAA